jgi:hypothetical protein
MVTWNSPDKRTEMMKDVDARIRAHPMHRRRVELDGIVAMLRSVLSPNGEDLVSLLRRASTDPETFISLAAAQQFSPVAMDFRASLARHLHNYLASAYTLQEQADAIMKSRRQLTTDGEDELDVEWQRRTTEMDEDPGMAFIMGLRAYVQHYGQLPVGNRLHVDMGRSTAESELTITMSELEAPVRWKKAARTFIADNASVDIRELIQEHLRRTIELHRWLIDRLIEDSSSILDEYNELIAERASIQFDVDLDEARKIVEPPVPRRGQLPARFSLGEQDAESG